jgi:hypothetical protein
MRYWDRAGSRREEPTGTADWKEAHKKLRERLQARDDNVLEIVRKGEQLSFTQWAELFLENYSKPPLRTPKTHDMHTRGVMHLAKAFGDQKLSDLSSDAIEGYLRYRLRQRVKRKTRAGIVEKGPLKPSTVHQELRVLRRMLNVAVRKRLLPSNPCWGVEFPVTVKGLFRRTTSRGRSSSGSKRRRRATCATSCASSPRPGFGSTRNWRRCGRTRWIWRTRSS